MSLLSVVCCLSTVDRRPSTVVCRLLTVDRRLFRHKYIISAEKIIMLNKFIKFMMEYKQKGNFAVYGITETATAYPDKPC